MLSTTLTFVECVLVLLMSKHVFECETLDKKTRMGRLTDVLFISKRLLKSIFPVFLDKTNPITTVRNVKLATICEMCQITTEETLFYFPNFCEILDIFMIFMITIRLQISLGAKLAQSFDNFAHFKTVSPLISFTYCDNFYRN